MAFWSRQFITVSAGVKSYAYGVYADTQNYNVVATFSAQAYPLARLGSFGEGDHSIDPSAEAAITMGPQYSIAYASYAQDPGTDLLAYIVRWYIDPGNYSGPIVLVVTRHETDLVDNRSAPLTQAAQRVFHPSYNFNPSKLRVSVKADGSIGAYRLPLPPGTKMLGDLLPSNENPVYDLELAPEHKEILTLRPMDALRDLRVSVTNGQATLRSPTLPLPPPRS